MDEEVIKCFWSEGDKSYIATPVDHPSLTAFGDTKEEAYAELCEALILCYESKKEELNEFCIPPPKENRRAVTAKITNRGKLTPPNIPGEFDDK